MLYEFNNGTIVAIKFLKSEECWRETSRKFQIVFVPNAKFLDY